MRFLHKKNHTQHLAQGVGFALLAALSMALMSVTCKSIGPKVSLTTLLFFRFFLTVLFLLPLVIQKPKEVLVFRSFGNMVLRSIFGLVATGCFYFSLRQLTLSDSLVLLNTSPLFIPCILSLFHKIHSSKKMWGAIGLGFLGILLVLRPGPEIFSLPSLMALLSGIFSAASYVAVRFLTKEFSVAQILFFNSLIGSVILACLLPFGFIPFSATTFSLLLIVGFFGFSNQLLSAMALAKTQARIVTSLTFLSVIFGTFFDIFFFHEMPDGLSFVGMSIVIIAGLLTVLAGQKEIKK